jgi:hypothetical protein
MTMSFARHRNPILSRVMSMEQPLDERDAAARAGAFAALVATVGSCIDPL